MSFADALAAVCEPEVTRCHAGDLIDALDDEDREALLAAMACEAISAPKIVAALKSEGHLISPTTLRIHRRGECRCVAQRQADGAGLLAS